MPNSRPAVGAMADRTVSNGAVHTVTVPVSDADAGDAHTLSASSDDTSVASVTTSGRYAYLRGVGRGTATITVKATDDSGAGNAESAPETFRATVPNSHPSVDAVTAVTVAVGETVTLEPGIADPDAGDTHTVAASSADASIATVAVSGTRLTITGVARGRTTVTVAATDDSGGPDATSAARTFAVTVTPTTNSRPVVGALGDIELAAGTTRTATAGVTDADADDTHTVSANSTDLGVATVSVSGDEIEVAGVAAGTATITVTATDDSGAANATSEPATFAATVTATGTNTAPLVHPVGHVVVTEGATVTVTVGFEDGDGDGLTLSAVSDDPAVAAVSASSTRLVLPGTATSTELLLSGEAVGTAAVTVTAADGVATSTPMTFPVTIVARSPMAAARVFWVEPEVSGGDYTVNWNLPPGGTWELREYGAEGASRFRVDGTASARSFTGIPPGRYTYTLWRCVPGKNICFGTGTGSVLAVVVREDELLIETDTKPGNLPYRTGVTKGGDAYVDVPVAAVPGVNGLQPRLSIDYGGGRDLERLEQELAGDVLGYGWHLSGLSAIRRCVKDEEDADGISLDTSDRLCLDGEPLVLIGGYPLAAGAEYRTLRESFAKITLKADPNGNWFEVLLPDGGKREYGRTEDSLLRTRALQPAPFVWSVNKETDAFGNEMSYEYHEDEGTLVRHPKMIVYGHPDASGNGDAEIRFVYQGRRDIATVEVAGIGRRQWLRLHRIEAWQGGSKVREYRLESVLSPEGWRRLNRLQLCGYGTDGAAQCLAPLAVEWTTPAQGMEAYKTCVGGLTDALGARTQFVYGTLTKGNPHPFVLAPGDMPFGDFEDPADARPLPPADLPVDPPFNPADRAVKPVVVTVSRDDGVGGMRHTRYAYLGRGWKSTRNWGFLGFAAIREKDDASGIATYTQYRLDFPHLGRPAAVARYHGEFGSSPQPETLWKRYAAYAEWTVTHGTSAAMSTLPYVLESTDLVYEGGTLLGAVQTSDAPEVEDGLVKRTVRTTRSAHRATARTSPAGSPWGHVAGYALGEVQRRAETTLEFGNRTTGGLWLIGFAEGETVEHFDGNETSARRMTATRTPYGNTLAVGGSQRFPGDADLALTTAHGYDAQGNRTRTEVVSGAHLPAPPAGKERAWIADVFEAGRYPARSENPERHVESAAYDAGLGLATSVTDANGRETLLEYDAFGRKTGRTRVWDDATKTTTEYAWCAGAECAMAVVRSSCGGGAGSLSVTAVMKSTTTAPDAPRTVRYFDRLGRLVRTETEAFAGGAARRAEVFHDARGRVLCETTPHHAGQAAGYVSYGYDVRGRVVRTIRPDGGAAAAAYGAARHGTTATVVETVKRRQGTGTATATTRTTTRTYNFLGELVETVEGAARPAGSDDRVKTTYAYDGSGLATTVTAGATGAAGGVATTFGYDAAGNRTSVTNPNMGTAATGASARFEYDGLGRVRERTDGRGTTAYEYDLLGRPKKRTDPGGGVAIWGWDPANGKGLPGSRSYGAAFSETYVYDADARLKTATTAIAAGGRTESFRTTHAYDDRGRPSSTTHPSGAAVTYGYNAQGLHGDGVEREHDAGGLPRRGRLGQLHRGGLRQRRGDGAGIRGGHRAAGVHRHEPGHGADGGDDAGRRLRLAQRRLAAQPDVGGNDGDVRVRRAEPADERDDGPRRGPGAVLRLRPARQPGVEDEFGHRRRGRDRLLVRRGGQPAGRSAGPGRDADAALRPERARDPLRGGRRRPLRGMGRARARDGGAARGERHGGDVDGAGRLRLRPGRGALPPAERVEGGRRDADGGDLLRGAPREDLPGRRLDRRADADRDGGGAREDHAGPGRERRPGTVDLVLRVPAPGPPGVGAVGDGRVGRGTRGAGARSVRRPAPDGLDGGPDRGVVDGARRHPRAAGVAGIHGARASRPDRAGAHERPGVRPAARAVPEPGPGGGGPVGQPGVEPLQLRRQQPAEPHRPHRPDPGGRDVQHLDVRVLHGRRRWRWRGAHGDGDNDGARVRGPRLPHAGLAVGLGVGMGSVVRIGEVRGREPRPLRVDLPGGPVHHGGAVLAAGRRRR